jgi:lipid A 4'-phosphatase
MSRPVDTTGGAAMRLLRLSRCRHREALAGVGLLIVATALFSIFPEIDLSISGFFQADGAGFVGQRNGLVLALYRAIPPVAWTVALACAAMLVVSRWRPVPARWRHRAAMLLALLVVGDLGVVNLGFKEIWGRARPAQIAEFGGPARFTPALRPTDQCRHNCSFVSGHASAGFALMAVGALGSARTRRRWLAIGAAAGLLAGLARISQGGHFASDIVFAGLVMWATLWALREAALRWRRRRRRRPRAA